MGSKKTSTKTSASKRKRAEEGTLQATETPVTEGGSAFETIASTEPAKPKGRKTGVRRKESSSIGTKKQNKATSSSRLKAPRRKSAAPITADPFAKAVSGSSPVRREARKAGRTAKVTESTGVGTAAFEELVPEVVEPALDGSLVEDPPKVELSPVFLKLAQPRLPELPRENRARLLMQDPRRLYFYWSIRNDPWPMLRHAFGDVGSYTLVLKLREIHRGTELMHPADAEGNWWFSVEPAGRYQAEIGFHAAGRPYFRIIYSNVVETPRLAPSPRTAEEPTWKVTDDDFAAVLDVAGFRQDAYEIALADELEMADETAREAFRSYLGQGDVNLDGFTSAEIRQAIDAIAAGSALDELRYRVSPSMFVFLQGKGGVHKEKAEAVLSEYFTGADHSEEQVFRSSVIGASAAIFPKRPSTSSRRRANSSTLLSPSRII